MNPTKPICPACKQILEGSAVVDKRTKIIVQQFRCPSCNAWISPHPLAEYLKFFGFLLLLICSIAGFFVDNESRTWILALGFVGACIGFVGVKTGRLVTLESS